MRTLTTSLSLLLLLSACASTETRMGGFGLGYNVGEFQSPPDAYGLLVENSVGHSILYAGETNERAQVMLGDFNEQNGRTYFSVSDFSSVISAGAPNGAIYLGDPSGWGNITLLVIDDAGARVLVNVPIVMLAPSTGHWWSYQPDASGHLVGTDLGTNP